MSPGTRLFVSNIPENTSEDELRCAFYKFGKVNSLDLKCKSSLEENKTFAFITLSASNYDIESCIKCFTSEEFKGSRLYVTRARESFLERLQRERNEAQRKETEKEQQHETIPNQNPIINLSEKLNPRKRKFESHVVNTYSDTEKKRLEAMKQKRQEFKQKQMIIKTGLSAVDKLPNKKVKFSDEDSSILVNDFEDGKTHEKKLGHPPENKNYLFDDEDDDDADGQEHINFEIKKQFEGKRGQMVLDLQSRYKSDKRFTLDERFVDDETIGDKTKDEEVELSQVDEKTKQLNILQNVLGVTLKSKEPEQDSQKTKPKLGMLRFDPLQPSHAKFLMQQAEDVKTEPVNKKKKKKDKLNENQNKQEHLEQSQENKIEVSKETFYKVSETLKETIAQPKTFSLRSLFTKDAEQDEAPQQETEYIPLDVPKKKKGNPLDPGEKNPFIYDSSDSEHEEEVNEKETESLPVPTEAKAVWKENLFFTKQDQRLLDGLKFFNTTGDTEGQKDRRELKSLMKRRIYNKERKNQMFHKKIGGRRKTMKKSYRKKN
ncbi:nucleolar protein 8 [Bombyx mandarina]|uniref:Nucleolar protein 8 n=1 Tax=Bombyx mandarina TaxID=7092 RepID=A0A6J2JPM7_BOMMA|nr:nucleolar protein 8 [Bombyx mandarina]